MMSSLLGGLGGASGGGEQPKPESASGGGASGGGPQAARGGYQGLNTGANDGAVIAKDLLSQFSGQGSGPSDGNLIRNLFGTLLGDPGSSGPIARNPAEAAKLAAMGVKEGRPRRSGVLGGLFGGIFQAVFGGAMGFIQNKGIEAVVTGLTAAGASGTSPMAIFAGIQAFLGAGGAKAIAGAADKGLGGFRKGGGMAATQTLAHELGGNVGQLADKLTNGATSLALGGQNERPGGDPKPRMSGSDGAAGGGADADNDTGAQNVDADNDTGAQNVGGGDMAEMVESLSSLPPEAIKSLPPEKLAQLLKFLTAMAGSAGAGGGSSVGSGLGGGTSSDTLRALSALSGGGAAGGGSGAGASGGVSPQMLASMARAA